MERVRAAAPLLLVMVMLLASDCHAGRVFFPGPSIGPAPPSLWQNLHSLRQARRLDGKEDGGAPELRAAGVRIGQKYSDLEEPPLLQSQQQRDGGLQPLQGGDLEHLQPLEPLEPLDFLEPLDIPEQLQLRGQLDVQQDDDRLPLRVNGVDRQQNSEALQSLGPLPFFLAAEPRGAELSSDVQSVMPDQRGFNSLSDEQDTNEFVSFGDGQPDSDTNRDGFSEPAPEDIISLDDASDVSETVLVTGQVPEGVVYAAPVVEDVPFDGRLSGELRLPSREEPRPHRQDLQSSASVLASTSVPRPETRPPFRRPQPHRDPVRPRPSAVTVAEGSDQNLLNLLVTQGVLRPVGRVRVARLRLVTDAGEEEQEEEAERSELLSPAPSDEGEVIVEDDASGGPSELVLDERRQFREEPAEAAPSELRDEGEVAAQDEEEDEDRDGRQTLTAANDERERVLNNNIVPILSEKEFFDRLVTPRASSSSTIASTASDTVTDTVPGTVSVAVEEPADAELMAEGAEDRQRPVVTPDTASLAARLTELGSRVSRQGVWGRRLSAAAPTFRRRTEAAENGQQDDRQDGWQRRIDVGEEDAAEAVFVDSDVGDAGQDLDAEGSERHDEVAVLEEEGSKHKDAVSEVDAEGNVHWEAAAPGRTQSTRTDIIPEHTVSFRTDNSIEEDEDTGPPQLVAEMHNCPELGGRITLECRIKNAPKQDEIKRFWWMRRHFDGEERAVRDELLAVNGASTHTTSNISVQQVTEAHQRLVVTAVAAANTGPYMCQAGWGDTLQEVEMLVFLCH